MTRDTATADTTDRAGTPARSVARVGGTSRVDVLGSPPPAPRASHVGSTSPTRGEVGGGRFLCKGVTTTQPTPPPSWGRSPSGAPATPAGGGAFFRFACFLASLFLATGCRQIGKLTGKQDKPDLLEAELRTRERELQEARSEIQHLRQLAELTPGYCPPTGAPAPHGVKTSGGIPLRDVLLGNGTGGLDEDGRPGDEGLMVALVPKDDDGTAVKVPGTVQISAFEISREGLKTPIGKWRITPEQLKKTWKSSLLSSGYFIPLQWDKPPTTDRVRIAVRFETGDGKPFEADKDVPVKPLPGVGSRPADPTAPGNELPPPSVTIPPGAMLPGPILPPDGELLPPPAFPASEPAAILKPIVPK